MSKYTKAAVCLTVAALILLFCRTNNHLRSFDKRLKVLETKAAQTVEIHVERAYDEDMAAYGYKMIAVIKEGD